MDRKPPELHGLGRNGTLRDIARHEAGHLVMLWLLDRPVLCCMAGKEGGVTRQLKPIGEETESPVEHVLHPLAGMLGEWNADLYADLQAHIGDINWFKETTDSCCIATGISYFKGDPEDLLGVFTAVTRRLLTRFSKPHREAVVLLLEHGALDFKQIYDLFEKWDAMYFHGDRPKSDLVVRYVFRMFGWRLSRKDWYGWDLKPLPPDWSPRPKRTLEEIAEMVRKELASNVEMSSGMACQD